MDILSQLFTAFLGLITLVLAWWYLYNQRINREYFKRIPSPPSLPVFGHALLIKSTKNILPAIMGFLKKYGKVVKLDMGPFEKLVVVTDYKLLEMILGGTKIMDKSVHYKFLEPWLGKGLLTSTGPKWKRHRKMITPTFHFKILEDFVDVYDANGTILKERFEKNLGDSVDVYPFVTMCTLDIICETAMGVSVNAQKNADSTYVRSVKEMCRIIAERTFSVLKSNRVTFPLTADYYNQKNALAVLHGMTNDVIRQRRAEKEKQAQNANNTEMTHDEFGIKKRKAFLDLLLDVTLDGQPLTHEEIREEVDTFMFEGHDTTASAISFSLYCLANNPDVQAKALQEQKKIFGDNIATCSPIYADLQEMKYLEKVIKETLRLYPSVPAFSRCTNSDIEFDGYIIPKGVSFSCFVFGTHRCADYFPNPEQFNPDRFDTIDGSMPFAYIPFSAGPRNCIGQKFAMLEMKSTISKILRNFELYPAKPYHQLELVAEAILKSANGIKIGMRKRQL